MKNLMIQIMLKKVFALFGQTKLIWLALLMVGTTAHAGVTVRYQHTDALGSVIMETNASGQMIGSRHQYQPFGQGLNGQKTGLGYTGHLEDTDLGLTYMQQRYYDPVIGRFYSNDPVGFTASNPMMFNRYAYANNNPYKFVDPDGKDAVAVVFPDYQITVGSSKYSNLGHAGVLLINPQNGFTKYHEFGRYQGTTGLVRSIPVSNVVMENGMPTAASMAKVMSELSTKAGLGGAVEGAYFKDADYSKMNSYASGLVGKNSDNGGYGDWSVYNSCGTFMQDTLENGGVDTPWMTDPRPNSYIKELQGAKGAQSMSFKGGVYRVNGRIDSRRLDK